MSVEPREAAPPAPGEGPPPEGADEEPLPDAFVGVFGPIADATDAPDPAGLGRREPQPGHPHPPERAEGIVPPLPSAAATPYGLDAPPAPASASSPPHRAPIGELETPLYAPRHPARDAAPPEPAGEKTVPPERDPLRIFEQPRGAAPAIPGGWTAPPPPPRPRTSRQGPSATTIVAGILAGVIALAVLILGTVIGSTPADHEPRVAPGTEAPPAAPAPPPAPVVPTGAAVPDTRPVAPPVSPPPTEVERRAKLRLGKKKDVEP